MWIEVGYELEQFITDGFAGETSRDDMAPRSGRATTALGCWPARQRIVGRIAQGATSRCRACAPEPRRARRRRGLRRQLDRGAVRAVHRHQRHCGVACADGGGSRGGWGGGGAAGTAASARSAAASAAGSAAVAGLAAASAASADSAAAAAAAAAVARSW